MKFISEFVNQFKNIKRAPKMLRYTVLCYLVLYILIGACLFTIHKISTPVLVFGYLMATIVYITFCHIGKEE